MKKDNSNLSIMKESLINENNKLIKIIQHLEEEMNKSIQKSRKETEDLNKILHLVWPQIQSTIKRKTMQGYGSGSTMSDLHPHTSDLSTQTDTFNTDSTSLMSLYIEGLNEQLNHIETEISDITNSQLILELQKDEATEEIKRLQIEKQEALGRYENTLTQCEARRKEYILIERENTVIKKYKESDGGYIGEV